MVQFALASGKFLSTPSARRATPRRLLLHARIGISIHALREEGDSNAGRSLPGTQISIHALREEGDLTLILPISFFWIFLSTPSARRATG